MAKPVDWNKVSMLTPGMKNLGNQFNKRWPGRDGTSDGAIGDYAHTQEDSDHNPDDTSAHNAAWDGDSDNTQDVRAIDVDNNLNDNTVSMQQVIDHMRKLPNLRTVIRYMIYNGKMYHERNNFNPETYTGASKHTEHAHFSGAWTESADQNKTFDYRFDELGDDMSVEDVVNGNAQYDKATASDPKNPTWLGNNTGRAVWDDQFIPNPISGGKTSAYSLLRDLATQIMLVKQGLSDLSGKDFTDESAIIEGVLAGLAGAEGAAETIADAVVGALPPDLAKQVVDEMAKRLSATE